MHALKKKKKKNPQAHGATKIEDLNYYFQQKHKEYIRINKVTEISHKISEISAQLPAIRSFFSQAIYAILCVETCSVTT